MRLCITQGHPFVPSPQCYPVILQEVLERLAKVQTAFEIRLFCEVMLSAFHKLSGTNTPLSINLVSEWVVWCGIVWSVVYACMCTGQKCTHVHAFVHTPKVIFLSYLSVLYSDIWYNRSHTIWPWPPPPPSDAQQGCNCPRAPPTLLASFGEDTAETEEEMNNAHMWCEV